MAAPGRDKATWRGGSIGEANGYQRRDSTAVVECNGSLFVETPHIAALFERPHRNIMPGVDRVSRRLGRQSGFIQPQLIGLLVVSVPAIVAALATILGGV